VLSTKDGPAWREEYGGWWALELGLLAVLLAVAAAVAPLGDPDLPMHLALGEWIVRHGAVPTVEPFAWTRAGAPFYAYSWLPEVAFYLMYDAGGVTGLRIVQGIMTAAIVAAVFVLARLARWSIWTAIVLAGVQGLMATALAPYLRPHMVLLLAVPLAWGCALRMLEADRPLRWAVGLFTIGAVAANSHLLFPLTAAPWLILATRWPGGRRAGWLIGATVAGWLVTPYLFDWPAVFALNFNENPLFTYPTPISELTPGVQAAVSGRGGLLAIAVMLSLLPWAARRLTIRERVVWGGAWLAGLFAFALAARAIVLWWMLVLPLVAAAIEPLARAPRRRGIIVGQRIALAALVAMLAMGRARVADAPWAADTGAQRFLPTRAAPSVDPIVRWLECRVGREASGRAFTAFPLGTYLTWRHPALSYSIDTRNIFPDSVAVAEGYVLASRTHVPLGPWRSADLAIVPLDYAVSAVLDSADGWRPAVVTEGSQHVPAAGLWVTSRWWRTVSDSALPAAVVLLPSGKAGLDAACG
jgi:hypothetical protein